MQKGEVVKGGCNVAHVGRREQLDVLRRRASKVPLRLPTINAALETHGMKSMDLGARDGGGER